MPPKFFTFAELGIISTLAITLPTPFGASTKFPFVFDVSIVLFMILMLESTGPAVKIAVKLVLVSVNAVRKGSPVPSFAAAPVSMIN